MTPLNTISTRLYVLFSFYRRRKKYALIIHADIGYISEVPQRWAPKPARGRHQNEIEEEAKCDGERDEMRKHDPQRLPWSILQVFVKP